MSGSLMRIGTSYIPVQDIELSAEWYVNLGAVLNYQDKDKAILDLANQSIFLVRSSEKQSANFYDIDGTEHFSLTFEVNGMKTLTALHREFKEKGMTVDEIEDRGHAGKNFVFRDLDGNMFDVWSELSPIFKEKYRIN